MPQPDVWTMFWLGTAMSIPTGIAASLLAPRAARILGAAFSSAVAFRTVLICYEVDDAYRTIALPGAATLSGILAATLTVLFLATSLVGGVQLNLQELSGEGQAFLAVATKTLILVAGVMGMGQLIRLYRMVSASRYPVERIRRLFEKAAAHGLALEPTLGKWGYKFNEEADGFRWMGLTGYQKFVPVSRASERDQAAPEH